MKNFFKLLFKLCIIVFLFILFGCEPISLSINSKGEIAFARSEGVFFVDLKKQKLDVLDWNYGQPTVPVIVRWSPKEDVVACTVKENKDSSNTSVVLIDKKGNKKQIYSVAKIITQMEWSTDGSYISVAQAGEDTDMSVADLALISVKDGMSKVFAKNTGDIHKWVDGKALIFIKVLKKNKNNSDILLGELIKYTADSGKSEALTKVFVSKSAGSIDIFKNDIAFIAIDAGNKLNDFPENMTSDTYCFIYNQKSPNIGRISGNRINYAVYSPDGAKLLIKYKEEGSYNSSLGVIDAGSKAIKMLSEKSLDTVSVNSSTVQVYPAWLDNNNVLFFIMLNTYGSSGQSIQLMSENINDLKITNNQLFIDTEIYKLMQLKGGY
jgi:hypothetical protein